MASREPDAQATPSNEADAIVPPDHVPEVADLEALRWEYGGPASAPPQGSSLPLGHRYLRAGVHPVEYFARAHLPRRPESGRPYLTCVVVEDGSQDKLDVFYDGGLDDRTCIYTGDGETKFRMTRRPHASGWAWIRFDARLQPAGAVLTSLTVAVKIE